MAATSKGAALTARHKAELNRVQLRTARDIARLWKLLDPANLDASYPAYEGAVLQLIADRRALAATLAAAYFVNFREAEGLGGGFRPVEISSFDVPRVMASLRTTSVVRTKSLILRGVAPKRALQSSLVTQTGAVTRIVIEAAQETTNAGVREDSEALGWLRVPSGTACYFCAMLASRGPVYQRDSFVESNAKFVGAGEFKTHDHCGCSVEPVFTRDTAMPDASLRYRAMWDGATANYSGHEAVKAFRAQLEGRPYPPVSR